MRSALVGWVAAVLAGAGAGAAAGASEPAIRFTEVAERAGIRFINMYGGVRSKDLILETTGTGAALFDYDADGDLDLFLANGSRLGYGDAQSLSSALFRNDGAGSFTEVTGPAGLESYGWAQGVAVTDHENDGDLDLLVTRYGPNLFFRNRGDGTFEEVAAEVGLDDPQWGAGAAFGDLDRDGAADLVVVHYVDLDPETTPGPGAAPNCFFLGIPVMCGPKGLRPAPALLYRAEADGSFRQVSDAGVGAERVFGLGVVLFDLEGDGDLDIYAANDQTPNHLYRNDSDGGRLAFREIGLAAGVAYNEDGRAQAGMGVDAGDVDGDGRIDLVVTNFSHDYNTLYRAAGDGWFLDESFAAGIAEPSYPYLGWGAGLRDFDLDGWLDLLVVNGHVYPEVEGGITDSDYAQAGLLFRNAGAGQFTAIDPGPLAAPRVYRGAAFGDTDGDGDPDVVATVMNGAPAYFRNESAVDGGGPGAWAGFRLVGRTSPRDGAGTRLVLDRNDGTVVREARTSGSYLAANDPRVVFGLGDAPETGPVRLTWPSGCRQTVDPAVGQYQLVVEPPRCPAETPTAPPP